ncbi:hypothetical protein I553_5881 [Mycobacterium xenopi 4042]|uniref:Uncharacterized protein n=1 Tax=Mycobacterium xenopi 4042 TaxID=1299334 RepID=X7ZYG6_MYCXE|nr:hypothetical protein I553_5881 [Mycobacterium xenopi 4042]
MLLHVARDRAAVADLPRSPCYAKATAASRCRHGMAGETRLTDAADDLRRLLDSRMST